MLFTNAKLIAGIAIALTLPLARPCSAQGDAPELAFKASLASSRIMMGEPFVLLYKVANTSAGEVETDWAREHISYHTIRMELFPPWLSVHVIDERQFSLDQQQDLRAKHTALAAEGTGAMIFRRFGPGDVRDDQIVLSRWFTLPHPGRYRITVEPHLSYTPAGKGERILTDSLTFDLTVLPANAIGLHNTAAKLRDEILTAKDNDTRCRAIQKLFAMPEGAVLRVWKEVFADARLSEVNARYALAQMQRIDSPTAPAMSAELYRSGKLKAPR